MKIKALVPIFFSILVGFLFGRVIFDNYHKKSVLAFNEGEKVYLVKLASYDSLDKIENSKSLLVLSNDSSYNLYAGITKQKDNANKIVNDALIKSQKLNMEREVLESNIKLLKKKIRNNLLEQLNLVEDIETL